MTMKREVYVVNLCDAWESYASFGFVGIFTSRKKLNVVLNKLLKKGDIEWRYDERTEKSINKLSEKEMSFQLRYVNINKVTLNEIQ
jgi:hypothetical protein